MMPEHLLEVAAEWLSNEWREPDDGQRIDRGLVRDQRRSQILALLEKLSCDIAYAGSQSIGVSVPSGQNGQTSFVGLTDNYVIGFIGDETVPTFVYPFSARFKIAPLFKAAALRKSDPIAL